MNTIISQVSSEEFLIPSQNIESLEEKLEALNKKAKRLKIAPISLEKLGTERKEDANGIVSILYRVRVTGEAPIMAGWSFIATLQHTAEGNIIRSVPGMVNDGELTPYRDVDPKCDHCKKSRRRIDTYVLRSEQGETKQVGKSCLKDFTGHENPLAIASMAEFLAEAVDACEDALDDSWAGLGAKKVFDVGYYLSWVHACIREYGWISSAKAFEEGKSSTAQQAVSSIEEYCKEPKHVSFKPAEKDKEVAKAALEWILGNSWNKSSDYLCNVSVACKGEVISHREYGLVASLFVAYNKAMEIERERKQAATVSEWQGEVGKRGVFKLMCNSVYYSEGQYGTTSIYKLSDTNGNQFVWFSSQDVLEVDTEYNLKATVKSFDEYKCVKQTVLTRCKVQ
jgi:hypothetical protein